MAADMKNVIMNEGKGRPATVIGHSMGGRTAMYCALNWPQLVQNLVVVDVSPVNRNFDAMSSSQWNMSHFFHTMKSVEFPQDKTMSEARKSADEQMSVRISDPMRRAWLLMNVHQNESGWIGWRINLDAIHRSFKESIAKFPDGDFDDTVTFDKPTLFIGGEKSDYLPVNDHDEILERFTRANFEYIEDAGHWLHSEKPNEFLDVLFKFIK